MVYRAFILTQVRCCQKDIIGQELIKLKTTYYYPSRKGLWNCSFLSYCFLFSQSPWPYFSQVYAFVKVYFQILGLWTISSSIIFISFQVHIQKIRSLISLKISSNPSIFAGPATSAATEKKVSLCTSSAYFKVQWQPIWAMMNMISCRAWLYFLLIKNGPLFVIDVKIVSKILVIFYNHWARLN
jgi:hypothetical protein